MADQFRAALDEIGVTHESVPVSEVTAAVERAVEGNAVGVPSHVDAQLPDSVKTDFSPIELRDAQTGVTPARLGVAELGSLLVRSGPAGDELVSLYPPRHVAVVREADIVPDIPAAVEWLREEFAAGLDSYVFATGISATADMSALVEGVHGPTEVHTIIVNQ